MFVYVVFLHCDRCDAQFEKLALDTEAEPVPSKDLSSQLDLAAHQAGWFRYKDGITCDSCLVELAYQRELAKQDAS